jgi:gluconate kinase
MPSTLLDSQLATLEELRSDEPGLVVEIGQPENVIVKEICLWIAERNAKLSP